MDSINRIAAEMDNRIEHLKVFYPIFKIDNSNSALEEPFNLTNLSLALLAILLEEGKLKFKGLLIEEIAKSMQDYIAVAFKKEIAEEESRKLVGYLLDRLQGSGSNFAFPYYSCEHQKIREKVIKLVEMQIVNNRVEYQISRDGLDFFLKTKEFPEESQITISLLLLRKQIQGRLFETALQTVKNLNIQVKKRLAEKRELLIVFSNRGDDFRERYELFRRSIVNQFNEENSYFTEINGLLNEAREDYLKRKEENKITETDQKSLAVLYDIEAEIGKAVHEHRTLLESAVLLPEELEKIRKMRIRTAHAERFNFLGQLERVVKNNEDPEVLKFIVQPLLMPRPPKFFNPLKALALQKVVAEEQETTETEEPWEEIEREYLDRIVARRVCTNFRYFIATLLRLSEFKRTFTLVEWFTHLKAWYGEEAAGSADIIGFIVALNKIESESITKQIFLERVNSPLEEDSVDLNTVINIIRTLGSFANLPSRLEVTPLTEEDVDLGHGIKATNLVFKGVD